MHRFAPSASPLVTVRFRRNSIIAMKLRPGYVPKPVRVGIVMLVVASCAAVAIHHEMPVDMDGMATAAMCLGVVLGVGLVVTGATPFLSSRHSASRDQPSLAQPSLGLTLINFARAGPERAGVTVIQT